MEEGRSESRSLIRSRKVWFERGAAEGGRILHGRALVWMSLYVL